MRALGIDTILIGALTDPREQERAVFNRAFAARGLPVEWNAQTYARVIRA